MQQWCNKVSGEHQALVEQNARLQQHWSKHIEDMASMQAEHNALQRMQRRHRLRQRQQNLYLTRKVTSLTRSSLKQLAQQAQQMHAVKTELQDVRSQLNTSSDMHSQEILALKRQVQALQRQADAQAGLQTQLQELREQANSSRAVQQKMQSQIQQLQQQQITDRTAFEERIQAMEESVAELSVRPL